MLGNGFLVLILFRLFCLSQSFIRHTLNQGHFFNATDRLVSRNGRFVLGFSGNYLVINYTDVSADNTEIVPHPLWLANRNIPILENSGALTVNNGTGSLKIVHKGGKPIVLYSGNGFNRSVTADLQDNGNFVLKEANSGHILWQSFDYPTDTLLPGMKLGINHRTGKKGLLQSWRTEDNPIPGSFTLEWDHIQRQILVRRKGVEFWTSGVLTPDNRFDNLLLFDSDDQNYNFTSVSNEDEDFIVYTLYSDERTPEDRKIYSRWFLDYKGNIREDAGRPFTLSSESCDGKNTDYGCKKWEFGPECRRDGDKFAESGGYFIGHHSRDYDNQSMSFIDCQDLCWEDCACTAFRLKSSNSCRVYTASFRHQDMIGGQFSYYVIVPGPRKQNKAWIRIVIGVLSALSAAFLSLWLYLRWRRLRLEEKFLKELMTDDRAMDVDELQNNGNRGYNLEIYNITMIISATNHFSLKNKLGEGGFGPVYKGKLSNGQEIAVKRLSCKRGQGIMEFKNELILIAKLQHMNLVRLLGFCIHGEEKMLVYEYMPNKSLDYFIFGDESRRAVLDSNGRFNIIEGIAQGLVYLHKYSRLRVIHRDLKASNVLLDKDMNPKISDFGLSRFLRQNESEANTLTLVGTRGYMSPEYIMEGIFSAKSDVYSFGVLLLEIISGRKNHNVYHHDRPLNLVGYVWESWKQNSLSDIVEPTLQVSASENQVTRCINIGLLCVEQSPAERPNMSDVLFMLTNEAQQLPMPKQPAFYIGEYMATTNQREGSLKTGSINDMSVSKMEGR